MLFTRCTNVSGMGAGFNGYAAVVRSVGTIELWRWINGSITVVGTVNIGTTFVSDTFFEMEYKVVNGSHEIRAWLTSGSRPSDPQLTVSDWTHTSGYVGVGRRVFPTQWDTFEVEGL